MSVTAVPIRPIKKGSVTRLWLALALLAVLAGAFAWLGTAGQNWTTTASGLQYRVVKQGTGPSPSANDIALINYEGKLADGTVFDSNLGQQPAPLPVSGSIPGFAEGLQLMNKGAVYQLRIPPELGYGPAGAGGGVIPPNATLDFEVTLQDFQVLTADQLRQLQMMQQMQQMGGGAGAPPPQGQ